MRPCGDDLKTRVIEIVAVALDRNPSEIRLHSSLIDDLGAESIDFLDIRFRLETDFHIKIADEELWRGALNLEGSGLVTEQGVCEDGIGLLKERMPEFRWELFPRGVSKGDLPRLITVSTIMDYLENRLRKDGPPKLT